MGLQIYPGFSLSFLISSFFPVLILWLKHQIFNFQLFANVRPKKIPCGGFHSHGGTLIAGWFSSWKIRNMDDLGVPPFIVVNPHYPQDISIIIPIFMVYSHWWPPKKAMAPRWVSVVFRCPGDWDHQPLRLDLGADTGHHWAERHADPGGDRAGGCHAPPGALVKSMGNLWEIQGKSMGNLWGIEVHLTWMVFCSGKSD